MTEFQGLKEFRLSNPYQFNGEYDSEREKLWIQEMKKIFEAMMCPNERKGSSDMCDKIFRTWRRKAERLLGMFFAQNFWQNTFQQMCDMLKKWNFYN